MDYNVVSENVLWTKTQSLHIVRGRGKLRMIPDLFCLRASVRGGTWTHGNGVSLLVNVAIPFYTLRVITRVELRRVMSPTSRPLGSTAAQMKLFH